MKQEKLTKACGYLRMSTDRQDTSIPIQKKRLLELAEREGYEIIQWYKDEGCSASMDNDKRVGWLKMLAGATTAEWGAVLCYNRSRFSRLDSIEEAEAKQALRMAGKKLHTAVEGLVDWDTSAGRIIDTVHSEASNQLAATIGNNVLEGRLKAFLDRKGHGQICPYGMDRCIVDPKGRKQVISRKERLLKPRGWTVIFVPGDPEEIKAVQWLFETYATEDVGFRWLARELNARGVPSAYGKRWSAPKVLRVFQQAAYVGDTRFGRQARGKFSRLDGTSIVKNEYGKPPEVREGLILQNTHKGIIDRELWNRVQEKIKRNGMQGRNQSRGRGGFPLKGILVCGHCGHPLFGRKTTGRNSTGAIHYLCRNAEMYGMNGGCREWHICEKDILPFVVNKLAEAIDLRVLASKEVKPPRSEQNDAESAVALLEAKIIALDRKITGAEQLLHVADELGPKLKADVSQWKSERVTLAEQLEEARRGAPSLAAALREWREWFAVVGKRLVEVQTSPPTGAKIEPGVKLTPAIFREKLREYGCRVICWWTQISPKRWEVEKVRILMGSNGVSAGKTGHNQGDSGGTKNVPSDTNSTLVVPLGTPVIDLTFSGKEVLPRSVYWVVYPLIKELRAQGHTCAEIAKKLNEQGYRNYQGTHWGRVTIQHFLQRAGLKGRIYHGPKWKQGD